MAVSGRRGQVRNFAEGLVKVGALQFGAFTLPDGRESSYYVNLKGLSSYPGVYRLVVDSVSALVAKKASKLDALCGVPTTGLVIAAPVAVKLGKPLVYVNQNARHGERTVEGEVMPDWKIAVIEDLATSGRTILKNSEVMTEEGGEVTDAFVLIDRLEGARQALSKEGIALHSVTDMRELAETLFSMGLITEENRNAVRKSASKNPIKK